MPDKQNSPQKEEDIIALLNYFKRGILEAGFFIYKLVQKTLEVILNLILHIKKNIVLIGIFTLLGLGYYISLKNALIQKANTYEMIIESSSGITQNIYNTISYLEEKIKTDRKEKLLEPIKNIEIIPIKDLRDEVTAYNKLAILDLEEKGQIKLDSVYVANNPFKEFVKNFADIEYKRHKIIITSDDFIETKTIQQTIEEKLGNNQDVTSRRKVKYRALAEKKKSLEKEIKIIDTLLLSYAKRKMNSGSQSDILLSNPNARNNPETDLLTKRNKNINKIFDLQIEIADAEKLIFLESDLKLVKEKERFAESMKGYIITGFLIGLVISLLLAFYPRLLAYEKKKNA